MGADTITPTKKHFKKRSNTLIMRQISEKYLTYARNNTKKAVYLRENSAPSANQTKTNPDNDFIF